MDHPPISEIELRKQEMCLIILIKVQSKQKLWKIQNRNYDKTHPHNILQFKHRKSKLGENSLKYAFLGNTSLSNRKIHVKLDTELTTTNNYETLFVWKPGCHFFREWSL